MERKYFGIAAVLLAVACLPAMAQYTSTSPPDQASPPPSTASRDGVRVIPQKGQSEQQQWSDRYECHGWAKTQSGFDPTLTTPGSATPGDVTARRDAYRRAFSACMEGHGYSVTYGQPGPPAAQPQRLTPAPAVPSRWVSSYAEPEIRYHPLQVHVDGGFTITTGDTDRRLDDGSNIGFGLTWFPTSAIPVGLRVDGSYSTFDDRHRFLDQFGPGAERGRDNIYGGDVDLQLDLAHGLRSKFYVIGGAGWYRDQTVVRQFGFAQGTGCGFYGCGPGTFPVRFNEYSTTPWRSSWNAGLGWEVAFADRGSFFVEARYLQIAPRDSKMQFVPIRVGVRF
jgi:opacity protein-like surface antigen